MPHGYSSERTQQGLSNGYQHDRVWMVFKNQNLWESCDLGESSLRIERVTISFRKFRPLIDTLIWGIVLTK